MNETSQSVAVEGRRRSRSERPRLLVTNDDGVGSDGLKALAGALRRRFEVIVVAPEDERSGAGTGIGYFDPSRGVSVTPVEVGGGDAFALAGPPGLAVMSAMLGAYGEPPDLVVSGINHGINTGHSVVHSGTVGAVITARTFGCDGVAVSLAAGDRWEWESAVAVAEGVVDWVCRQDRRSPVTLNVNVPAVSTAEIRGVRWADLDEFGHFRVAVADVPGRRLQFEVGARESGLDPASDTHLLREGFATITPLSTIEPTAFPSEPPPSIPAGASNV